MLSREETLEREPLLREKGLKGSGLYVEYRTDDARLTLEVMKTAFSLGAKTVNYAEAESFVYDGDRMTGARVRDRVTGGTRIGARKVVNAAGPWVDELRKQDGSLKGKRLHLTKGIHLVVSHECLPLGQPIYFDVPDGRMIFAIPKREDHLYWNDGHRLRWPDRFSKVDPAGSGLPFGGGQPYLPQGRSDTGRCGIRLGGSPSSSMKKEKAPPSCPGRMRFFNRLPD